MAWHPPFLAACIECDVIDNSTRAEKARVAGRHYKDALSRAKEGKHHHRDSAEQEAGNRARILAIKPKPVTGRASDRRSASSWHVGEHLRAPLAWRNQKWLLSLLSASIRGRGKQ